MKWLGKEQLFKIPFLGWMMWLAGDIPVKRGRKESIVSAMNGCTAKLKQKLSVMIFPEGTRVAAGETREADQIILASVPTAVSA